MMVKIKKKPKKRENTIQKESVIFGYFARGVSTFQ